MEKMEFKGCLLTGRKAGVIANYTEPLNELVQIRINSCVRQQMLEYVLRFKNSNYSSRPREYRVGKDVFDIAADYLSSTATSIIQV